MRARVMTKAAAALTAIAASTAAPAAPASAAPYIASCKSGVLAPQVCTFALATSVATFAERGQYAIVREVPVSRWSRPNCPDGSPARTERYRGQVFGRISGARVLGQIQLDSYGCPDAYPSAVAQIYTMYPSGSPQTSVLTHVCGWSACFAAKPGGPGETPSVDWRASHYGAGRSSDDTLYAAGPLFRRHTGMSVDATGGRRSCVTSSNGACDYDASGTYPERDETGAKLVVNSSISGHWARVYLDTALPPGSTGAHFGAPLDVDVTAQPYAEGWRVTRVR